MNASWCATACCRGCSVNRCSCRSNSTTRRALSNARWPGHGREDVRSGTRGTRRRRVRLPAPHSNQLATLQAERPTRRRGRSDSSSRSSRVPVASLPTFPSDETCTEPVNRRSRRRHRGVVAQRPPTCSTTLVVNCRAVSVGKRPSSIVALARGSRRAGPPERGDHRPSGTR